MTDLIKGCYCTTKGCTTSLKKQNQYKKENDSAKIYHNGLVHHLYATCPQPRTTGEAAGDFNMASKMPTRIAHRLQLTNEGEVVYLSLPVSNGLQDRRTSR